MSPAVELAAARGRYRRVVALFRRVRSFGQQLAHATPARSAEGAGPVGTGRTGTGKADTAKAGAGKADAGEQSASAHPGKHQPGAGQQAGAMLLPTLALLRELLDEFGLIHGIDNDGDLVVRWERCSLYFFFYGAQQEVLQARLYLNRRFPVEARAGLVLLLDEWNRTKLFPKAYTVLPDDGLVGVCGEQCHDFEPGVTREQLKYAVGMWVESAMRFADWFDEQL